MLLHISERKDDDMVCKEESDSDVQVLCMPRPNPSKSVHFACQIVQLVIIQIQLRTMVLSLSRVPTVDLTRSAANLCLIQYFIADFTFFFFRDSSSDEDVFQEFSLAKLEQCVHYGPVVLISIVGQNLIMALHTDAEKTQPMKMSHVLHPQVWPSHHKLFFLLQLGTTTSFCADFYHQSANATSH